MKQILKEQYNTLLEKDLTDKYEDVESKVKNSKTLPKEMKEKIYPLIVSNNSKLLGYTFSSGTSYNKGKVFELKYSKSNGCSLGADKDGFFVYTHRARSKSYPTVDKITKKDIKFIKSTG